MIRILHLLLAANLLVSTMGVGLFEHLCQMRGYSVSVMAPAKSCCAKKAAVSEHCAKKATAAKRDVPVMTKAPCCQDHASWMQADLDATPPVPLHVSLSNVGDFLPVLAKAELPATPVVATLSQKVVQAMRYKPPCPTDDVRVRVQSFQI